MNWRLWIMLLALLSLAVHSVARADNAFVLRGIVESVIGSNYSLKTKFGAPLKLTVGNTAQFIAVGRSSTDKVAPGTFVRLILPAGNSTLISELQLVDATVLPLLQDQSALGGTAVLGEISEFAQTPDGYRLVLKSEATKRDFSAKSSIQVVALFPGQADGVKVGSAVVAGHGLRQVGGPPRANLIIYGLDGIVPNL